MPVWMHDDTVREFFDALGLSSRKDYTPAFGHSARYYRKLLVTLENDETLPIMRSELPSRGPSDGVTMVRHRGLLAPNSRRELDKEF